MSLHPPAPLRGGRRTRGEGPPASSGGPLISVIQPTFNAAEVLEPSIRSVLGQSYPHVEYLVLDGGSTDGTVDLLRRHEDRLDYWASEPDRGIYDAMSKGVEQARGDWLYFLGADDLLHDVLHQLVPRFRHRNGIYYGDVLMAPRQNRIYDGPFPWHRLILRNLSQQAVFYPREVFSHYRFNLAYRVCADYDLNLRLWADRRFRPCYLPVVVATFNDEQGVSSQLRPDAFEEHKAALVEQLYGRRIRRRQRWLTARHAAGQMLETLGLKGWVGRLLGRGRRPGA